MFMIEIELKYKLNKTPLIEKLPESEEYVEDIYYDTIDYRLLRNGNFLRLRNNNRIDFKLSTNDLTHLYCKETSFDINDFDSNYVSEILKDIGVNISFQTHKDLLNNLIVLAPIKKHRKSYKLEKNVVMVIDEVDDLGAFLEIEYDLDKASITKEEADYYKKYLEDILNKRNLISSSDIELHIGYVELYLKEYNIEAFNLGIYK